MIEVAKMPVAETKLRGVMRRNFAMARLSTWRVGGAARLLFSPEDVDDLLAFMSDEVLSEGAMVVGYGSNLLVRDGGIDGAVVRTAPGLAQIKNCNDGMIYAEAGVGCPKLARFCARNQLTGGEFFVGVPGTVGGALAMNAGCYGFETWNAVVKVRVISNCRLLEMTRADFDIGYRYARAKNNIPMFFVGAWFKFAEDTDKRADATMKEMLQKRAAAQPLAAASAGSVFRNPPGGFAGKLIAECGLANKRVGGAQVSDKHCNFIINTGDATARDIETLINQVREQVQTQTGVELQTEVRIVGQAECDK